MASIRSSFAANPKEWGAGLAGIGGGLGSLFGGGGDVGRGAMRTLGGIPDMLKGYYNPYIDEMRDPSALMKRLGAGYQQSPGFQFSLNQALQSANQGAAAGGMAGSPLAQQHNMEIATQLGNQDYENYLNHALGIYGQGAGMSTDLAQSIAQALAGKAGLSYASDANKMQQQGTGWGNIFGGIGSLIPFFGG